MSDCVDRKAVLDLVFVEYCKNCALTVADEACTIKCEDHRAFMEKIAALPAVAPERPKWIPVSERLPENAFGCLVTVEVDDRYGEPQGVLYPEFVGYDGETETWNNADGQEIPFDVIAWMPLPEPYREGDDVE